MFLVSLLFCHPILPLTDTQGILFFYTFSFLSYLFHSLSFARSASLSWTRPTLRRGCVTVYLCGLAFVCVYRRTLSSTPTARWTDKREQYNRYIPSADLRQVLCHVARRLRMQHAIVRHKQQRRRNDTLRDNGFFKDAISYFSLFLN